MWWCTLCERITLLNSAMGPAVPSGRPLVPAGEPVNTTEYGRPDGGMSYGRARHPTLHLQIILVSHCPPGHSVFRNIVSTSLMPCQLPPAKRLDNTPFVNFIGLFISGSPECFLVHLPPFKWLTIHLIYLHVINESE